MNQFRLLKPEEAARRAKEKVNAWKKEIDDLKIRGIPAHSEPSLVLRNTKARKVLSVEERERLNAELVKAVETPSADCAKKVKRLLEAGADPNCLGFMNNWDAPLMTVATAGMDIETMELLISYGADPNLQDREGNTALILAARNNNKEAAKLLLEKGADPYIKNKEGKDAMAESPWVTDGVAHVLAKFGVPLPPAYSEDGNSTGGESGKTAVPTGFDMPGDPTNPTNFDLPGDSGKKKSGYFDPMGDAFGDDDEFP